MEENNSSDKKTCNFYVSRKKRKCRMLVAKGNSFCGQHMVESSEPNIDGHVRIPCPLDPKHSCYSHLLEQHLQVCNAKDPTHLPYFKKAINAGNIEENSGLEKNLNLEGKSIAQLTDEQLLSLIDVVLRAEKEHTEKIVFDEQQHPSMDAVLTSVQENESIAVQKHLLQNASLLAHLDRLCNLSPSEKDATSSVFIEFGAGRGQLSHWVAEACNCPLHVLMVDRGAQRYKFDSKLSRMDGIKISRLRVDIADLALNAVEGLDLGSSKLMVGGKHLCGAATDLSLRCLRNSGVLDKLSGLVVALCCHHRCSWQHYVGKTFLQSLGLSEGEFSALTGITSWAVCAARAPKLSNPSGPKDSTVPFPDVSENCSDVDTLSTPAKKLKTSSESRYPETSAEEHEVAPEEHKVAPEDSAARNRYQKLGLAVSRREAIGRAAKHLLNTGRLLFLRANGIADAKLLYYIKSDVTLENVALVASSS